MPLANPGWVPVDTYSIGHIYTDSTRFISDVGEYNSADCPEVTLVDSQCQRFMQ